MSMNKFLRKFRSEDDASFGKIWESERLGFIAKNYKFFKGLGKTENASMLEYDRPLELTYELPPNIEIDDSKLEKVSKAIEAKERLLEITYKDKDGMVFTKNKPNSRSNHRRF